MKGRTALVSSAFMGWESPTEIVDLAHEFSPISLDPCTAPDNPTRAARFYAPPTDAMALAAWGPLNRDAGHVYINPPYGEAVKRWMPRLREEMRRERQCTILIASRTDTGVYHELRKWVSALIYVKGRLRFRARCEFCALNRDNVPYAERWYRRPGRVPPVFLCAEHAEGMPTKPMGPATFPSLLAYYGPDWARWLEIFGPLGDGRSLGYSPLPKPTQISFDEVGSAVL